jgi:hypothetical protein
VNPVCLELPRGSPLYLLVALAVLSESSLERIHFIMKIVLDAKSTLLVECGEE